MKKKLFVLLVIILLIVTVVINSSGSNAYVGGYMSRDSHGGKTESWHPFVDNLVSPTFDEISSWDVSTFFVGDGNNVSGVTTGWEFGVTRAYAKGDDRNNQYKYVRDEDMRQSGKYNPNLGCLHKTATGSDLSKLRCIAVLDINIDGKGDRGSWVCYTATDDNGGFKKSGQGTSDDAARIAYVSWLTEYWSRECSPRGCFIVDSTAGPSKLISQILQSNSEFGISYPLSNEGSTDFNTWANTYAAQGIDTSIQGKIQAAPGGSTGKDHYKSVFKQMKNNNQLNEYQKNVSADDAFRLVWDEDTCLYGEQVNISARVLFFKGGGSQECVVMHGSASAAQVKIDKYITETKDASGTQSYGTDRAGKTDNEKESDPVAITEKGTEITYKIVITNEGSEEVEVKYIDDYSDGDVFTYVSGDKEKEIKLGAKGSGSDKAELTLVLKYDSNKISGKYENKAIVKSKDESKTYGHSSDWIEVGFKPKFKIDKYVTYAASTKAEYEDPPDEEEGYLGRTVTQEEFEDELGDSRAGQTDEAKESNPVHLGYNIGTKTVKYKIVITNEGENAITGTLTDICELNGWVGGTYTIEPGQQKEIEFTAYLYSYCKSGKYRNKAIFRVGTIEKESSDWVILDDYAIDWSATLTKEAIHVETSGEQNPGPLNRDYSGRYSKDSDPVEVVQGSIVTFRLTATNYTWYRNTSDKDHAGNKDSRINQHYADMTFYDYFDPTEFEFVNANTDYTITDDGKYKFSFSNITYGGSAVVEIQLKVLVDNMHLLNLYNYTTGVELSCSTHYYQHYDVPVRYDPREVYPTWFDEDGVEHYYYNSDGTVYHYTVYDIEVYAWDESENYAEDASCRFIDYATPHTGEVSCFDYDCARVLDPEIAGVVFWDRNKDGYKDPGDEIYKVNNGETGEYYLDYTDYQDITVELWDAATNSIVAGPLPINIDTSTNDATSGTFSFGRVRKGTSYSGSQTTSGYEQWAIGEYNHFRYTGTGRYNYYVVFNYNGLKYEATYDSVDTNLDSGDHSMLDLFPIDSNASEINRDDFNKKFETIANDKAFPNITGKGSYIDLEYTEKGQNLQKSFLTGNDPELMIKTKSFQLFYPSGEIEYLKHINLGVFLRPQGDMSATKDVVQAEVTINGYQTIYNYGKLGVDGGTYQTTTSNTLSEPYILRVYREDYEFRTESLEANKGYKGTVTREDGTSILLSDLQKENNLYTSYGRSNDLEILLTYRITVKNDSGNADAYVREVMDYSNDKMEFVFATLDDDAKTPLIGSATSKYSNISHAPSGYTTIYITGDGLNQRLAENDTISILVTYKVLKDSDGYIYKDALDEEGKSNTGEIGAFSLYIPGTNTPAGMIDGDSNPGNANPSDTDHFEDDTFKTTILILLRDEDEEEDGEKQDYRNVSGLVWEEIGKADNPNSDMEKVGNGEKDGSDENADIFAKNVLVKLYEVIHDSVNDKDYYVDTGMWYRTFEDGRYYFGDKSTLVGTPNSPSNSESTDDCYRFHAGNYFVRFIYGDEWENLENSETREETLKYSGQDYKSTIYTEPGTENNETEILEATKFAEKSGDASSGFTTDVGGTIYSFAKDNELRRLEVNTYSTTMTYPMDSLLKVVHPDETTATIPGTGDWNPEYLEKLEQYEKEAYLLAEHTGMYADTKEFRMRIEYYDNYDDKTTFVIDAVDNNGVPKTVDKYYHSVRDINFGLTERPLIKMQLMNDITEVKAVTSDGRTLIDIFFDIVYEEDNDNPGEIKHTSIINYDKSIGYEEVQILNRIPYTTQGFRYANIDTDILQGMTITVKFKIAIANISDVDHFAGWLEDEIENNNLVELSIDYFKDDQELEAMYDHAGKRIIDTINKQRREYNYENNYLFGLVEEMENAMPVSKTYSGVEPNTEFYYNGGSDKGSGRVRTSYSFKNIQSYLGDSITYYPGYFLGTTYFTGITKDTDKKVQTRVDQYIDYVDNDLIFKPEENIDIQGQVDYLTYTTEEIAKKGLLKNIVKVWNDDKDEAIAIESITDGEKDYYNASKPNANNNLAFNIEKEPAEENSIKLGLYKFLKPIDDSAYTSFSEGLIPTRKPGGEKIDYNKNGSTSDTINSIGNPYVKESNGEYDEITYRDEINKYLYVIDIQASRTLSSEMDMDGMVIDNIAEIIKLTNTVGRKAYVATSTNVAGYIGNTTKEPIESVHATPGKSIVEIAKEEIDTDFTEYVTFSPPTGLSQAERLEFVRTNKVKDTLLIGIPLIIIIIGLGYVGMQVMNRKKFYK